MDAREARRQKLLANSAARLARLAGPAPTAGAVADTASTDSREEDVAKSLLPEEALLHDKAQYPLQTAVLERADQLGLHLGEIKPLANAAAAPVETEHAPAAQPAEAAPPKVAAAPAAGPTAPPLEPPEHAGPLLPAGSPTTAPASASAPRTAAPERPAPPPSFQDRVLLRWATVLAMWLVHLAVWLHNARQLAAADRAAAADADVDDAEGAPASAWTLAWVEYATALRGERTALTGPPYLQLPVLMTWLAINVALLLWLSPALLCIDDALRQRSSGPGPQGGILAWVLKAWSARGDLTALVQDGMLLLFLLVMTGLAYPLLLDLAPALV